MPEFFPEGFFDNSMGWINAVGYLAAAFSIAAYSMKTIIPLRVAAIFASAFFLVYGYLAPSYPQIIVNAILLPMNVFRLRQMMTLIDDVKSSSDGALALDWLSEYGTKRLCQKGETLFRKGDAADAMFYTVSGRYVLSELEIEIEPGQIVGEIGIVAPENLRTQTFKCTKSGEILSIGYDRVKELYFQNPRFGFYFLDLIAKRLIANNVELQNKLTKTRRTAPRRRKPRTAKASVQA
jgi:CRP-like cAMP-binding protein